VVLISARYGGPNKHAVVPPNLQCLEALQKYCYGKTIKSALTYCQIGAVSAHGAIEEFIRAFDDVVFDHTLVTVLIICSTSSGPSFFRTNFPIEITSRISPLWFQTAFPMT
jgi:hypothetical protein